MQPRFILLTAFLLQALATSIAWPSQTSSPQTATVPFVGCPADGMSGPAPAPKGEAHQLPIPADAATRLAYYSSEAGGVLAPRGWHCFEIYGSDGAFLVVSPEPVAADTIYSARRPQGYAQPVVVISFILGFTSGRDEVAPVINRVFRKDRAFVIDAARNNDQPIPRYKGPFPGDKLHYLSPEAVEFTTSPHREGLGTVGLLRPAALPISGVEMLVRDSGECCDLTSVAIRLAPADAALATIIRQQFESESTAVNPSGVRSSSWSLRNAQSKR